MRKAFPSVGVAFVTIRKWVVETFSHHSYIRIKIPQNISDTPIQVDGKLFVQNYSTTAKYTVTATHLVVADGSKRVKLKLLQENTYKYNAPKGEQFTIPMNLFKAVTAAGASKSFNPVFTGTWINKETGGFAATTAYSFLLKWYEHNSDECIVVSKDSTTLLAQFFEDVEEVTAMADNKYIMVRDDSTIVISPLLNHPVPDISPISRYKIESHVSFSSKNLQQVMKEAWAVTFKLQSAVTIKITPTWLHVSSSDDVIEYENLIPYDGEIKSHELYTDMYISARELLNTLHGSKPNDRITLQWLSWSAAAMRVERPDGAIWYVTKLNPA